MSVASVVLIVVGIVSLIKPDIFQRPIWKKTGVSQDLLKPKQDNTYTRIMGLVCIAAGVALYFLV